MSTDHQNLRRVLRAGPSALARTIHNPAVINALREPEALQPGLELPVEHRHEPSFDVFGEDNEVLIVGEMPGVTAEQIYVYGYTAQVVVHVRGRGGRYSVRLPQRIEPTSISYAFHNGILTVRANQSGAGMDG